ncbi:hypothetical protein 2019_scaffold132_00037 [Bacteriophage sp.]|nr:hypothetical protein 2019_scaffold132_00037 [Bacteriophage sp.]
MLLQPLSFPAAPISDVPPVFLPYIRQYRTCQRHPSV